MTYTVTWLPAAEQELAAIWLASARRDAVTRAADALERRLGRNAPDEGESRDADNRIAFEPPLAVIFRVDQAARTVAVGHIRAYD